MRCYNHSSLEAVGICRYCFKGICRECCQENYSYLACSEECARKIQDVDAMNERALEIYGIGKYTKQPSIPLSAILFFSLGVLCVVWGATMTAYFVIFMGLLFFVFSYLMWKRYAKLGVHI